MALGLCIRKRHRVKLCILSRYSRLGASSRLRTMQYIPALKQAGFEVEIAPFFDDAYLTDLYSGRRNPLRTVGYFANRLSQCRTARKADLLWIEKEALPWAPWALEQAILPRGVPYIVDYDDAVFHRYDQHPNAMIRRLLGRKIDAVMAGAACVTAGNAYLEARAWAAGASRVERVPTVVDLDRYFVAPPRTDPAQLRVGWIGTPQTWAGSAAPTYAHLRPVLATANATFLAIGASLVAASGDRLQIQPWHERAEVADIQAFDIGIMPLPDDPWTRGKCGYKLIQYMACGIPVIASPIGVNTEIVQHGVNGFLASTPQEWRDAVTRLLAQPDLRKRMGAAGRARVVTDYSLQAWSDRICKLFQSVKSTA